MSAMSDVVELIIARLEALGQRVSRNSDGSATAQCPAHGDRHPSLSIGVGNDGVGLLKCHAGCETDAVCRALGMSLADLFPRRDGEVRAHRAPETVYPYTDENGGLLFEVVRLPNKQFRQRRPTEDGNDYVWNLGSTRRVPFHLPEVITAAKRGDVIYVAEGERDVEALRTAGVTATCNPGGAGKWRDEYSKYLSGASLAVIVADRDEPGVRHAEQIAESLAAAGTPHRIVQAATGKDAADHLAAGHALSDFIALAPAHHQPTSVASVASGAAAPAEDTGLSALDASDASVAPAVSESRGRVSGASGASVAPPLRFQGADPVWPELDPVALYGVAGDIVRAIEPESESDPAALLFQLLVAFGSAVGRGPYFPVEADKHGANLFLILVGVTAKGRKGTSWGHIQLLVSEADTTWQARVHSGLSTGEGLAHAVRDPYSKREPIKERGRVVDYQWVEVDPGVSDKRLLAMQPEFSSVLRTARRENNTLSALVRQAWDTGTLQTLTKTSPTCATDTHIAIVGNITADELRAELTQTDAGNGFGNRFLYACVKRSKLLPFGGHFDEFDRAPLVDRLRSAIETARKRHAVRRDGFADQLWEQVYPELSSGHPGLLGAMTGRAEAQVMRLALNYALLDEADAIRVEHLRAAIAAWSYCEASATFVFGESLGDPVADELLDLLRASLEGMTRTEIRDAFQRHQDAARISAALKSLQASGLVERAAPAPTGGRPAERWKAVREKRQKRPKDESKESHQASGAKSAANAFVNSLITSLGATEVKRAPVRARCDACGSKLNGTAFALLDGTFLCSADCVRPRGACRWPGHRASDWVTPDGRTVCGTCHPPATRPQNGA
jgi:hypothetical protein